MGYRTHVVMYVGGVHLAEIREVMFSFKLLTSKLHHLNRQESVSLIKHSGYDKIVDPGKQHS